MLTFSLVAFKFYIALLFFNSGGENPFDIEEKPVDLNGEDKNEEDTEDRDREDQDPGLAEDKGEGEDGGDKAEEEDEEEKEAADQEGGNTEKQEETTEEDVEPPKEDKNESAEEEMEKGVLTADQGLQPQVENHVFVLYQ